MSETIIQTAILVFAAGFVGFALGCLACRLVAAPKPAVAGGEPGPERQPSAEARPPAQRAATPVAAPARAETGAASAAVSTAGEPATAAQQAEPPAPVEATVAPEPVQPPAPVAEPAAPSSAPTGETAAPSAPASAPSERPAGEAAPQPAAPTPAAPTPAAPTPPPGGAAPEPTASPGAGAGAGSAPGRRVSAKVRAPETATPPVEPSQDAAATGPQEPWLLEQPRLSRPDDLTRIKGIGPKLEKALNDLGVYHFDQIASWTPENVAWVDARLRFHGRIEREEWISQASALAKG